VLSALDRTAQYEEWRWAYTQAVETTWRRNELELLQGEAQRCS
jgi:hypothetical protein